MAKGEIVNWVLSTLLVVLVGMTLSQPAVARDAFMTAAIEKIKVVKTAPAVQEQLKKASPDERKSLEDAIATGNAFVPLHFSGNAYDLAPENEEWDEETAPLVAFDRDKWAQHYEWLEMNTKDIKFHNVPAYTTRLVCPQVTLVTLKKEKEGTTLTYRTTSIGTLITYQGALHYFNSEGARDTYDISFELDDSAFVDKVIPPDQWVTWSYTISVGIMKRFLNNPSLFGGYTTKEHLNATVASYKQSISKIEKSAALVCK
jgi:hypothetical protein